MFLTCTESSSCGRQSEVVLSGSATSSMTNTSIYVQRVNEWNYDMIEVQISWVTKGELILKSVKKALRDDMY